MSDPTILLNLDKAVSITYIRKAKFVVPWKIALSFGAHFPLEKDGPS